MADYCRTVAVTYAQAVYTRIMWPSESSPCRSQTWTVPVLSQRWALLWGGLFYGLLGIDEE